MTDEEKKAFGEKMKLAREAKKNSQTSPKEEIKEETITISKSVLENLQADMKKLKNDRDILMATADTKAMAHYYAKNKEAMASVVRLRTFGVMDNNELVRKVVIGWRTIKNEVYQVPGTQAWREDQVIELIFEDKTKKEVPLLDFYRGYEYIESKVISSSTDELTKEVALKVVRDNGEELEIGEKFVN